MKHKGCEKHPDTELVPKKISEGLGLRVTTLYCPECRKEKGEPDPGLIMETVL